MRKSADLLQEIADLMGEAGGRAPEQPYPPTWLMEDEPPAE